MAGKRKPGPTKQEEGLDGIRDGTSAKAKTPPPGPINDEDDGAGHPVRAGSAIDGPSDDPEFLACVVLTYLGLPPSLWRRIVSHLLEAYSVHYTEQLGEVKGGETFAEFKRGFTAWSAFEKLKAILEFLVESKIAKIAFNTGRIAAIRERILLALVKAGVRLSGVVTAHQVVSKLVIALEFVWITGCASFCGATIAAKTIADFTVSAMTAVSAFVSAAEAFGDAIARVISRPFFISRGMADPDNWNTQPFQNGALVLKLFGNSIWNQLRRDDPAEFLVQLQRPIATFNVPAGIIEELAAKMSAAVNARGGARVVFETRLINGLTFLAFVQLVKEWGLLAFLKEPLAYGEEHSTT